MNNLNDAFEVTSVCRADLLQLEDMDGNPKFTKKQLMEISNDDIKEIARQLGDDYVGQLFWSSLDTIVEQTLEK